MKKSLTYLFATVLSLVTVLNRDIHASGDPEENNSLPPITKHLYSKDSFNDWEVEEKKAPLKVKQEKDSDIDSTFLRKLIPHYSKDFKDLILLICLIDAQNIPKQMLSEYKGDSTANQFLQSLKKDSVLRKVEALRPEMGQEFSMHPGTQKIILDDLIEAWENSELKEKSKTICIFLEEHLAIAQDKEELDKVRTYKKHSNALLKHSEILDDEATAKLMLQLGSTCNFLGNYQDANTFLAESLKLHQKIYGQNHLQTALAKAKFGNFYRNQGDYERAKKYLEHSYHLFQKHYGKNLKTGWIAILLGNIYRHLGMYKKAIEISKIGLEIHQSNLGPDHIKTGWALVNMGNIYRESGHQDKAKKHIEHALKITRKNLGDKHIESALISVHLGRLYNDVGEYEKAKELLKNSLPILQSYYGKNHAQTSWLKLNLAVNYAKLGKGVKAIKLGEEALENYKIHYGNNHQKTGTALLEFGNILSLNNEFLKAKNYYEQSLKIYTDTGHNNAFKSLEASANLRVKLTKLGDEGAVHQMETALNELRRALTIVKTAFPENSAHRSRLEKKISKLNST